MNMAGRVQTLGTGISGQTIQGRVFDLLKRSFEVMKGYNKLEIIKLGQVFIQISGQ